MHELRKNARFDSSGKGKIDVVPKCRFIIVNISITGLCVECTPRCEKMKVNEKYKINIKPEITSFTGKFDLEVECRWISDGENSSKYGFEIVSFPKGKNFQKYVDYLSYRSGTPKK